MAHPSIASPTDLGNLVFRSLSILNSHRAGPALGTVASSQRQEPARPVVAAVVNDEAAIAAGHAQRRDMLARRRAQQQLTIVMQDSQRLGVQVSTEQIVNLVTDTVDAVRACARR